MRWNRSRFDLTAGDKHPFFVADWSQDTGDATFQHRLVIGAKSSGEYPQLKLTTIYLLMTYAILHSMPEDALSDSYEALLDVYESHSWRAKKDIAVEPRRLLRGKLSAIKERPVFRIAED